MGKPRMTSRDKFRPVHKRYYQYANKIKELAVVFNYSLQDELSVTFVLQMPKSWSMKKKRQFDGQPHQSKPDLDNLMKAFKDALVREDSYVHTYRDVKKIWGFEGRIIIYNE